MRFNFLKRFFPQETFLVTPEGKDIFEQERIERLCQDYLMENRPEIDTALLSLKQTLQEQMKAHLLEQTAKLYCVDVSLKLQVRTRVLDNLVNQ